MKVISLLGLVLDDAMYGRGNFDYYETDRGLEIMPLKKDMEKYIMSILPDGSSNTYESLSVVIARSLRDGKLGIIAIDMFAQDSTLYTTMVGDEIDEEMKKEGLADMYEMMCKEIVERS